MMVFGYSFRPGLIPTLATLALLPVLVSLGLWQLDRAEQKQAMAAEYERRANQPAVPVEQVPARQDQRYRPVVARGTFDGRHQVLLDHRVRAGRVGYHVYTPMHLEGSGAWVLVNRGWVPHGSARSELPAVDAPEGLVAVRGLLDLPPSPGLRLGAPAEEGAGWPRVVQYLELEWASAVLDRALLPYVVLPTEGQSGVYARDWQLLAQGPERHHGYALQWFGLAAALLILFVAANLRHPEARRSGHD